MIVCTYVCTFIGVLVGLLTCMHMGNFFLCLCVGQ